MELSALRRGHYLRRQFGSFLSLLSITVTRSFDSRSVGIQAVNPGEPAPESRLAAKELSSPVKALMAILSSDSPPHGAHVPCSATIRHMVHHIMQLCTGAFARSPTAISTTIKPLTHLALASQLPKSPFPPAASIWVPTGHATGRPL